MTSERKLQILNALIEQVEKVTYQSSSDMARCRDDAKSFIRNAISSNSDWIKRIDSIRWSLSMFTSSTPDSAFASAWNGGKKDFLNVLASIKSEIEIYSDSQSSSEQGVKSNKIFIVHGHNNEIKLAVARLVSQLGLIPIILHEQPNKGRTIIEKFEKLSEDVSFAIVLLSADDIMHDGKYRARQNVILELGYFIAKLGRENVVALYDTSTEVEIPSDITGVLYEPYDNPNGVWRFEIIQELKAAGFDVDANIVT